MTMIFDVFTEAARGTTLSGTVQYRDPDNYGFSQGPAFGLQLIMAAWQEGGDFGAGPVSAQTEAEFEELFELYFGPKARVDEEGYLLEDGSTEVRIPRVKAEEVYKGRLDPYGGRGFSDGVHYLSLTPEPGAFARRTEEIIVSWEIEEDKDNMDGIDDEEGGSASFTLEVSDPRYLEHFTKNASFQTAFTGHLPSS
ncbi:hypothetical protein O7599_17080 [Streptomyces sp. WMMC500]|uniref:hypothetical protein n=1 Tax=Streptomyces sp. WMMC500 TaxID=3015154 RepID=UPI00248C90D7|nr:hypothetical protein [Streptomyces sp. WMMC500]WBB64122.1 hypothetical protein O7599_17080 [Streptomyces sp. WMMC500]